MNRIKLADLSLLVIAAALMFAGSARAEISDGLVSYWPLDDDTLVDVVGQNDGILMGSDPDPVFEAGQFNNGIVLDGIDQFIEIQGDESEFDFVGQDFSISAWFRVDAFTKDWQALIAKGEGNRWRVHRRGGEQIMTWNGGNADVPAGTNPDVNDGGIHHFVGVSTVDEVLMYMDGELVAIGPSPVVENNDMPVMIGENPDARSRTWEGLVDDVAIWGRALDESEVSFLWNDGSGRNPTDAGTIPPIFIGGENTIGSRLYTGDRSNEVFGPEQVTGGFTGRIVTFDEHGLTIDNHTIAEDVLDDIEGTTSIEAYPVVDMAGGGGTFGVNLPYPNGVADESMSDFAVRVTAEVKIPAGTYTIGFGSDDGGQLTIPGVEFTDFQNNDSFEEDQIRFEGNRGHDWTVGTFTLNEDLETSIVASFHERGGGDSFEIAVIDQEIIENPSPGGGWELLGDGTFGWDVKTVAAPLVTADLTATVTAARPMEFDVNGDTGEADQLVLQNPDPNVFTTILNVDGLTFQIKSAGAVTSGDAFTIIGADQVAGTPTITSVNPAQNWVFDAATGRVCLDLCPGGLIGDFNGDGVLDADDINDLTAKSAIASTDLTYDLTGDGNVDGDDVNEWISADNIYHSWPGDANLDLEFNSGDLVAVLSAGKYEVDVDAVWTEGDFNGDGRADSGDLVTALSGGGYELGPKAAVAAVPEPSSLVLALLSVTSLIGVARRRNG